MQKICSQSGKEFEISDKDLRFYTKYLLPPPTLCPEERSRRRLCFRNERNLYKRKCDFNGASIISIITSDGPYKVYSHEIYHSDKWDGLSFGREFNFSRPFFDQFRDLMLDVPRMPLIVTNNENCPFVNQCWFSKNCHLCFDVGFCEDALFCDATYHSKNVVDCSFVHECELCYWLLDCTKCYQSFYLQDCQNCHDAYFSFDCNSCSRILFCSNLRGRENCVFNRKVSHEEFDRLSSELDFEIAQQKFIQEVLPNSIHKANHNLNCQNCFGEYLLNCKDAFHCFDACDSEDLRYCNRMDEKVVSCMDLDNASNAQLSYEGLSVAGYNIYFSFNSYSPSNRDLFYTDTLKNCTDCFGCSNLQNKNYCILNKQYAKENYHVMVSKIIEHMKVTSEWGEFFPIELSPFAYNESAAMEFFPLSKNEVLSKGWRWRDVDAKDYQLPHGDLLACEQCGRNYKLIDAEKTFYQRFSLPDPKKCNDCRHTQRISFRNGRQFFNGKCNVCGVNLIAFSSDTLHTKLYCEKCYMVEVY